jgi:integrase
MAKRSGPLTTKFLEGRGCLPNLDRKQVDHWDGADGLLCRVSSTGLRKFCVVYDWNGATRRDTLSPPFPELSLKEARDKARAIQAEVAAGRDPRAAVQRSATAMIAAAPKAPSYADAVRDFVQRYHIGQMQNRSARRIEQALLRLGARSGLADRPLHEIDARTIRRALESVRDGTGPAGSDDPAPYMANRLYAYLKTMFSWAAEPGIELVEMSPIAGLKKPWAGESVRDRVFSDAELAALWRAAEEFGDPVAGMVKLLMLTGKRKGAIAEMKWSEMDDAGYWRPATDLRLKRGNKRRHPIPLAPLARGIVMRQPRIAGNPYVFASRSPGKAVTLGSKIGSRLEALAAISGFQFHAFRHTVETRLAEMKVPPHLRDLLLDHAPQRGAGAGYDHADYSEQLLETLRLWETHVADALRRHGSQVYPHRPQQCAGEHHGCP